MDTQGEASNASTALAATNADSFKHGVTIATEGWEAKSK